MITVLLFIFQFANYPIFQIPRRTCAFFNLMHAFLFPNIQWALPIAPDPDTPRGVKIVWQPDLFQHALQMDVLIVREFLR